MDHDSDQDFARVTFLFDEHLYTFDQLVISLDIPVNLSAPSATLESNSNLDEQTATITLSQTSTFAAGNTITLATPLSEPVQELSVPRSLKV